MPVNISSSVTMPLCYTAILLVLSTLLQHKDLKKSSISNHRSLGKHFQKDRSRLLIVILELATFSGANSAVAPDLESQTHNLKDPHALIKAPHQDKVSIVTSNELGLNFCNNTCDT